MVLGDLSRAGRSLSKLSIKSWKLQHKKQTMASREEGINNLVSDFAKKIDMNEKKPIRVKTEAEINKIIDRKIVNNLRDHFRECMARRPR